MSTKLETLSSTAGAAIAAASKSDVQLAFTDIPPLGTNPSAADAEKWQKATKACVSAWNIDPSGGVTGVQF